MTWFRSRERNSFAQSEARQSSSSGLQCPYIIVSYGFIPHGYAKPVREPKYFGQIQHALLRHAVGCNRPRFSIPQIRQF